MTAGDGVDRSKFVGTDRSPTRSMPNRLTKDTRSTFTRSLGGKVLSHSGLCAASSVVAAAQPAMDSAPSAATPVPVSFIKLRRFTARAGTAPMAEFSPWQPTHPSLLEDLAAGNYAE